MIRPIPQGLPGAGWDSQIEQASRASFALRRAPNEGSGRFDFGPRISKSSAERLSFVAGAASNQNRLSRGYSEVPD